MAKAKVADLKLSSLFSNDCFGTPAAFTFGTAGALPVGVFFGDTYDLSGLTCGWTAAQMQTAYGLPAVYAAGYKGQGETIVIVVAYGSPTLESDANVFNSVNGLSALTSSNFEIVLPDGPPFDPTLGLELG